MLLEHIQTVTYFWICQAMRWLWGIETSQFFGVKDSLFYDYFTGNFYAFKTSGNIINIPNNINNYWVFFNGQKLIQNRDYILTGQNQILLNPASENEESYIIFKETPNNFNYTSGNFNSLQFTGKYNHKCSQVYYNGIKQKIINNYIENANFDLISGNFKGFKDGQFLIYNNTNNFFV